MKLDGSINYLETENKRNRLHAECFTRLACETFANAEILIAHHIVIDTGEAGGPIEVSSADTMLFDHRIMTARFGPKAIPIMQHLASVPPEERDDVLLAILNGDWDVIGGLVR